MDGLSLLGMVAEQRLGEAEPARKKIMIEDKRKQTIMVRRDIVVKPEDVKLELQEAEDGHMSVDHDEMLGEYESALRISASKVKERKVRLVGQW